MCLKTSDEFALQSAPPMLPNYSPEMPVECEVVAPGELLRARQEKLSSVLHLVSGRVQLGILEDGQMRHQLGVVEGRSGWMALRMLDMPCAVDMVTETRVQLRRQPIEDFCAAWKPCPRRRSCCCMIWPWATGSRRSWP